MAFSPVADATFQQRLSAHRAAVEARLAVLLPGPELEPRILAEASRYSLLAPAKRARPILALLAAEHFGGGPSPAVLDFGCALEMVHAASLILDDLPSMDNARLRRGLPTVHRRFGEDMALLSAISLLNEAYAVAARAPGLEALTRLALVSTLTDAVGFTGLCAGQTRDLRERSGGAADDLHALNHQKTGSLFVAAVEGGALCAGADPSALGSARRFGQGLGEAFQILDDLLDAGSTPEAAGKDVGKDQDKPTVVSVIGPEAARVEVRRKLDAAIGSLNGAVGGPLSRFAEALVGSGLAAA